MAENKKSFVAYSDWNGMFKALPNEVAGELIKHIFSYVNDENPKTDNYVINALFEQIKATLKRDLQKWESKREQRSEAGKASAKKRAEIKEQDSTTVESRSTKSNDRERKPTVSVSDSVSVNDNIYKQQKEEVVDVELFKVEIPKPEHTSWRESWYMKFKTKPGSLSDLLDAFNIHLGLKEDNEKPKNIKDYKQHFYNWCNVQDRIQNLHAYKKGKKEGAL